LQQERAGKAEQMLVLLIEVRIEVLRDNNIETLSSIGIVRLVRARKGVTNPQAAARKNSA
jgi:hypothetical protein